MVIPPSFLATLVLGYLDESGCKNSCKLFLEESRELEEHRSLFARGVAPSSRLGSSLLDVIEDYYEAQEILRVTLSNLPPDLCGGVRRNDSLCTIVKHIVKLIPKKTSSFESVPGGYAYSTGLPKHGLSRAPAPIQPVPNEEEPPSCQKSRTPANPKRRSTEGVDLSAIVDSLLTDSTFHETVAEKINKVRAVDGSEEDKSLSTIEEIVTQLLPTIPVEPPPRKPDKSVSNYVPKKYNPKSKATVAPPTKSTPEEVLITLVTLPPAEPIQAPERPPSRLNTPDFGTQCSQLPSGLDQLVSAPILINRQGTVTETSSLECKSVEKSESETESRVDQQKVSAGNTSVTLHTPEVSLRVSETVVGQGTGLDIEPEYPVLSLDTQDSLFRNMREIFAGSEVALSSVFSDSASLPSEMKKPAKESTATNGSDFWASIGVTLSEVTRQFESFQETEAAKGTVNQESSATSTLNPSSEPPLTKGSASSTTAVAPSPSKSSDSVRTTDECKHKSERKRTPRRIRPTLVRKPSNNHIRTLDFGASPPKKRTVPATEPRSSLHPALSSASQIQASQQPPTLQQVQSSQETRPLGQGQSLQLVPVLCAGNRVASSPQNTVPSVPASTSVVTSEERTIPPLDQRAPVVPPETTETTVVVKKKSWDEELRARLAESDKGVVKPNKSPKKKIRRKPAEKNGEKKPAVKKKRKSDTKPMQKETKLEKVEESTKKLKSFEQKFVRYESDPSDSESDLETKTRAITDSTLKCGQMIEDSLQTPIKVDNKPKESPKKGEKVARKSPRNKASGVSKTPKPQVLKKKSVKSKKQQPGEKQEKVTPGVLDDESEALARRSSAKTTKKCVIASDSEHSTQVPAQKSTNDVSDVVGDREKVPETPFTPSEFIRKALGQGGVALDGGFIFAAAETPVKDPASVPSTSQASAGPGHFHLFSFMRYGSDTFDSSDFKTPSKSDSIPSTPGKNLFASHSSSPFPLSLTKGFAYLPSYSESPYIDGPPPTPTLGATPDSKRVGRGILNTPRVMELQSEVPLTNISPTQVMLSGYFVPSGERRARFEDEVTPQREDSIDNVESALICIGAQLEDEHVVANTGKKNLLEDLEQVEAQTKEVESKKRQLSEKTGRPPAKKRKMETESKKEKDLVEITTKRSGNNVKSKATPTKSKCKNKTKKQVKKTDADEKQDNQIEETLMEVDIPLKDFTLQVDSPVMYHGENQSDSSRESEPVRRVTRSRSNKNAFLELDMDAPPNVLCTKVTRRDRIGRDLDLCEANRKAGYEGEVDPDLAAEVERRSSSKLERAWSRASWSTDKSAEGDGISVTPNKLINGNEQPLVKTPELSKRTPAKKKNVRARNTPKQKTPAFDNNTNSEVSIETGNDLQQGEGHRKELSQYGCERESEDAENNKAAVHEVEQTADAPLMFMDGLEREITHKLNRFADEIEVNDRSDKLVITREGVKADYPVVQEDLRNDKPSVVNVRGEQTVNSFVGPVIFHSPRKPNETCILTASPAHILYDSDAPAPPSGVLTHHPQLPRIIPLDKPEGQQSFDPRKVTTQRNVTLIRLSYEKEEHITANFIPVQAPTPKKRLYGRNRYTDAPIPVSEKPSSIRSVNEDAYNVVEDKDRQLTVEKIHKNNVPNLSKPRDASTSESECDFTGRLYVDYDSCSVPSNETHKASSHPSPIQDFEKPVENSHHRDVEIFPVNKGTVTMPLPLMASTPTRQEPDRQKTSQKTKNETSIQRRSGINNQLITVYQKRMALRQSAMSSIRPSIKTSSERKPLEESANGSTLVPFSFKPLSPSAPPIIPEVKSGAKSRFRRAKKQLTPRKREKQGELSKPKSKPKASVANDSEELSLPSPLKRILRGINLSNVNTEVMSPNKVAQSLKEIQVTSVFKEPLETLQANSVEDKCRTGQVVKGPSGKTKTPSLIPPTESEMKDKTPEIRRELTSMLTNPSIPPFKRRVLSKLSVVSAELFDSEKRVEGESPRESTRSQTIVEPEDLFDLALSRALKDINEEVTG